VNGSTSRHETRRRRGWEIRFPGHTVTVRGLSFNLPSLSDRETEEKKKQQETTYTLCRDHCQTKQQQESAKTIVRMGAEKLELPAS
jgi:hypothetical protein